MYARTAQGAMTLPREFYTSEAISEEERQRIFSKKWLYAGHVSQLPEPGSFFQVTLDGESLLVVRDAVELWDMTNRQDWELCTVSQQGISSRAYRPGPYAALEAQLAAFDQEYLRALGRGVESVAVVE